jgi:hypothetical protein
MFAALQCGLGVCSVQPFLLWGLTLGDPDVLFCGFPLGKTCEGLRVCGCFRSARAHACVSSLRICLLYVPRGALAMVITWTSWFPSPLR